jgi:hypothetical protein
MTIWAGYRSRYSDWLRAGRSGDQIPVGTRFSASVQTDLGPHTASCTMGTGSFPGIKSGRDVHRASVPVQGCALTYFFHNHGSRRGWEDSVTPRPLFTSGKNRYPLYRRLCGPHGRSGEVRKISPPLGFDPRTVQPVASGCTDLATRPTWLMWVWI